MKGGIILVHTAPNPARKPVLNETSVSAGLKKHGVPGPVFSGKSWLLRIQASGFLRYQIRLIMGQLFKLGKKDIDLNRIQQSLSGSQALPLKEIAPGSGLILNKIVFQAD